MYKQAKKSAKISSQVKSASAKKVPVPKTMREIKKIQGEAFKIGLENTEGLVQNANEATAEVIDIGSYTLQSWKEFSDITRNICNNINNEIIESYQDSFSNCVENSKKAFECKTANDLANLQNEALRRMIESSFDKSTRFSKLLFESYAKALKPINEHVFLTTTDLTTDMARKLLVA